MDKVFLPVDLNTEVDLLKEVASKRERLQVKDESDKGAQAALATMKATDYNPTSMRALQIDGPFLEPGTSVTLAFDARQDKYFASGEITFRKEDDYTIKFKNLYKLQRRSAFRVTFPESVDAAFKISKIDDKADSLNVDIIDLSAEGIGLSVDDSDPIKMGSVLTGNISVGKHVEVPVEAVAKYQKKVQVSGGKSYNHLGCEFRNATQATSQKIAFIVNDTHRQIFTLEKQKK